ncbi:hypothetical protein C8R44DRAFT_986892 [Mycena epipterygia]|nr:hypothetical protein C8R44DRAFT_986892 [Mycena epipterygia]
MRISTVRSFGAVAFVTAVLAPFTLAVPVTNTVLTPGGPHPRENVREVPAGGHIMHVGKDIHVVAATSTGWITYAWWTNTGAPISSYKTSWTVPPSPVTQSNQLVYLFNAIEPSVGTEIVQPVLQYGISPASGSELTWGVANWYLIDGQAFHSPLIPVNVGQQLDGEIQLIGTNGTTFNYNSSFTNIDGSSLIVMGANELVWATVTLEAYGVTQKSDYPAGSTVFSGINLELSDGTFPDITWSIADDDLDAVTTTVNVGGSTNGAIEIHYDA